MEQSDLLEHYKRIIEISNQLVTNYDYASLLRKIVEAAVELTHVEAASILLLDDTTGQLRFVHASNIKPHEMEELIVPLEGSIAGWIVTHGEPRVIGDLAHESQHFGGVDSRIGFTSRNLLGVPMRTHDRVIGVMQAMNKMSGAHFNDDDIITLQTLANQAGLAIENAKLFQQSDFIAEMVHELRTPLAALKASTTLLKHPSLPEERRDDIVDTMTSETERLIRLTSEFLDVARLESGRVQLQVEPFQLYKLMIESAEVVAQQANDKNITFEIGNDDYCVMGDRGKVKQVILNLLTNAIKYNRPNGQIRMIAEVIPASNSQPQEFIALHIQDTGHGISREHQKNMFQKFYRVPTLENVERGTGLGLTICKHIVETHGGRIWLESEEGVGSTFSFTIPMCD